MQEPVLSNMEPNLLMGLIHVIEQKMQKSLFLGDGTIFSAKQAKDTILKTKQSKMQDMTATQNKHD